MTGLRWWHVAGIVVGVVVVASGLAALAFTIFVYVAMGSYGSNK